VDTHGDLRPEHIFLADNPQVIYCLEFSTELRLQDSANGLNADQVTISAGALGALIVDYTREAGEPETIAA
jgi:aminoglycoside phosphotransferase family enzyme